MPLVGSPLATAIKNAVAAIPEANRNYDAVWNAVGDAIVNYIKANAVVTLQSGSIATGVTVGGASVPVTGTGLIS
jgi:hypothetical protein